MHPKDLYYHFSGISQLVDEIPFLDKNLAPANTIVTGAPGDLTLTSSLGWAGIGESDISIDGNGVVTPEGAALGQFLYGSVWNTQYRSPPTFSVNYPSAGTFTVNTGVEAGFDAKIAIYLDGILQLEQNAVINTSYSIDVPAGAHTIKVDNTGTDWITISSYTFEGLGSQVDAYVLVSEGKTLAAGWALNNRYNHQNVMVNGEPEPTPPSNVVVEGFMDGNYSVQWYDPLTGALYGGEEAMASGGILNIPLNPFLWDVAFIVDGSPVLAKEKKQNLDFEIYPNPVMAGAEMNLVLPSANGAVGQISLLDMGGREVERFDIFSKYTTIQLSAELSAGMYWVKVESEGKIGTRPLMVTK